MTLKLETQKTCQKNMSKFKDLIQNNFDTEPIYDDKYLKTKTSSSKV